MVNDVNLTDAIVLIEHLNLLQDMTDRVRADLPSGDCLRRTKSACLRAATRRDDRRDGEAVEESSMRSLGVGLRLNLIPDAEAEGIQIVYENGRSGLTAPFSRQIKSWIF